MSKELLKCAGCTGCGACANACPVDAVSMTEDAEGFPYPHIDGEKCINCGACERVCAGIKQNRLADVGLCAAARSKDPALVEGSSSGGFLSVIAEKIIADGGAVFGAALDESCDVKHVRIDRTEELERLRGAKYVQSDIGQSFREIKELLAKGRTVLFIGTPCQAAGLASFVGQGELASDKLIIVDFICHGVPSPGVWRGYRASRTRGKRLKSVSFRDKKYGWNDYAIKWSYQDGKAKYENRYFSPYLRGFSSNLFLRPSCYECRFKGTARCADVTVGDCWGVEAVFPRFSDGRGTSVVLLRGEKTRGLWESVKDGLEWECYPIERVLTGNASIKDSASMNPNRERFFDMYKNEGADKALRVFCTPPLGTKLKESLRIVYHRVKRR